jgi:hypothetical protein
MHTTEFYESYKSTTYKLFLGRVRERVFFPARAPLLSRPCGAPSPTSGTRESPVFLKL